MTFHSQPRQRHSQMSYVASSVFDAQLIEFRFIIFNHLRLFISEKESISSSIWAPHQKIKSERKIFSPSLFLWSCQTLFTINLRSLHSVEVSTKQDILLVTWTVLAVMIAKRRRKYIEYLLLFGEVVKMGGMSKIAEVNVREILTSFRKVMLIYTQGLDWLWEFLTGFF